MKQTSKPRQQYTVRESLKAKRVILRISPDGKLEVVVPRGFDLRRVPALVEAKQDWIDRTVGRLTALTAPAPDEPAWPADISLASCNKSFLVEYVEAPAPLLLRQTGPDRLSLQGPLHRTGDIHCLLRLWLTEQGRRILVPWLDELSRATGLKYASARVRLQKTRWGSCSRRGTISLNARLLFLEPQLARYVLIHELCHLRHLNHSPEYWSLVAEWEPDCRALDRRLNMPHPGIPAWAREG